ncbi:MAG: hypothetical protein QM756_12710 [Polyangiaceae bacterium]
MSSEQLTFGQTAPILRKLAGLPIVLIGGQALNCWCEIYQLDEAALGGTLPTSKDVDFQADDAALYQSANRLAGSVVKAKNSLQFLGYVLFDSGTGDVRIDFLAFPTGLTSDAVSALAIPVPFADEVEVRVMHPIHCMISRIENLRADPEKYGTEHALGQLHASILCARAYLRARIASGNIRGALDDAEAIFAYCREKSALAAYKSVQADPLLAIPDCGMPENFYRIRLPQIQAAIAALRDA